MKVDLNISGVSKVVTMGCCPRTTQGICGIQYRSE